MIEPLSALAVASTAVSQFKTLVNAGRDATQALTKFSSAWADINEAERRKIIQVLLKNLVAV